MHSNTILITGTALLLALICSFQLVSSKGAWSPVPCSKKWSESCHDCCSRVGKTYASSNPCMCNADGNDAFKQDMWNRYREPTPFNENYANDYQIKPAYHPDVWNHMRGTGYYEGY